MNGCSRRWPAFSRLLGKCRGALIVYCLLAGPTGFDSVLLGQLPWAANPAAQPADEDDEDVNELSGEAILPVLALRIRFLPVRLPPHSPSPRSACRCPSTLSLFPCALAAVGPMVRNGVAIPLRC